MRGSPITTYDFSGGLNLEAAPYLLEQNQARDARNVHTNQLGQLQKRFGWTQLVNVTSAPPAPGPLTGQAHTIFPCNLASKSLLFVGPVSGSDDGVFVTNLAGTVTEITPAGLPFTPNTRWDIAQAPVTSDTKGPIFMMNGVDPPHYWTGTGDMVAWTAASGTIPATGKFLIYHGNRLWCRDGTNLSRVRYSGLTGSSPDSGNWDANNYVDLEPADGQEITGIAAWGAYVIVFKARKIYVITDTVTGANRQLTDSAGCIAHRTIAETPGGLMFVDEDQGVCLTDGTKLEFLSEPVDPLLKQVAESPSAYRYAAATYFDNRYWLSLPIDGSENDHTLEYDVKSQSWWLHSVAANDWALIDPTSAPRLYAADARTALISRCFEPNTFEDYGLGMMNDGAYWVGPQQIWGQPHVQKRIAEVRVDGAGEWLFGYAADWVDEFTEESGEIWSSTADPSASTFAPSSDDGEVFAPTAPSGDMFAPTSEAVTDRRYYTLGIGRAWSYRFYNADEGDFQIYSVTTTTTGRKD